jgi:hypothetical protein
MRSPPISSKARAAGPWQSRRPFRLLCHSRKRNRSLDCHVAYAPRNDEVGGKRTSFLHFGLHPTEGRGGGREAHCCFPRPQCFGGEGARRGRRGNRPVAFPEGAKRPCGRTGLPRRFALRNDGVGTWRKNTACDSRQTSSLRGPQARGNPGGVQRPCDRTGLPRRSAPRNDGARGEDPAPYSEEYALDSEEYALDSEEYALYSEESTLCSPSFILFSEDGKRHVRDGRFR